MDKMIITQIFTMATWQTVAKKSEATKQPPPPQNKTKHTTKTKNKTKRGGGRGAGGKNANN